MHFSDFDVIELQRPRELFLAVVVIGYQLLLVISHLLDFSKLFITLMAASSILLLLLPQQFWFNIFILSLFVFFRPIGAHLLVEFIAYAFAGLFLVRHLIDQPAKLSGGALLKPIILFLAAISLSLIEPYDFVIGTKNFLRYLLLFGVYWTLHNYLRTTDQIERGLRYYLFYTFIASISMLYGIILYGGSRKFGIAGIPFNDLLPAAAIVAVVYALLSETKIKRWMIFCCYLLFAIILAQTRGPWLGTLLTLLFIIVFLIRHGETVPQNIVWSRIAVIIGGIVICLLLVFVAFPDFVAFVKERLGQFQGKGTSLKYNSVFSRILLWSTAWKTFTHNPINGVGIDLFPLASHLYYSFHPFLFMTYVEGLDPHLLFLTFLCETGIIGAAAFLLLLVWNFRIGYLNFRLAENLREKRLALAILAGHFFVFVSSFYGGSWFYGQNGFQFILFLAMNSALYSIRTGEYATS